MLYIIIDPVAQTIENASKTKVIHAGYILYLQCIVRFFE